MTQEERTKITQDQYVRWKMNRDIRESMRREEVERMQRDLFDQWKARKAEYESMRDEIAKNYIEERKKSKAMTVGKLSEILAKLPADCTVMNDSDCEYNPTDIEQIWYVKELNEVYFTSEQCDNYSKCIEPEFLYMLEYKAEKIYDVNED